MTFMGVSVAFLSIFPVTLEWLSHAASRRNKIDEGDSRGILASAACCLEARVQDATCILTTSADVWYGTALALQ